MQKDEEVTSVMESPYSEKVMDHFTNPRNVGELEDPDGIGKVGNPICGDLMHLFIKVDEEGKIAECTFRTFGCVAAIATGSMFTELVRGKTLEEAERISSDMVAEALEGLPSKKMHCSNMGADALKAAIEDYYRRRGGAEGADT